MLQSASYDITPMKMDPANDAPASTVDDLLNSILHQKSHVAFSKLEILAAAMSVRISVFKGNLEKIDDQKEKNLELLAKLHREALYQFRDHREKGVFYQALNSLETERRAQSVECWRDLFKVIQDFLLIWGEYRAVTAKARFITDAG